MRFVWIIGNLPERNVVNAFATPLPTPSTRCHQKTLGPDQENRCHIFSIHVGRVCDASLKYWNHSDEEAEAQINTSDEEEEEEAVRSYSSHP